MKKRKVLKGKKAKQNRYLHEKYKHCIPFVVVIQGNYMALAKDNNLYAQYDAALDRTHVHIVSYSPNNAANRIKQHFKSAYVVDIYLRDLNEKYKVIHFKVKNP